VKSYPAGDGRSEESGVARNETPGRSAGGDGGFETFGKNGAVFGALHGVCDVGGVSGNRSGAGVCGMPGVSAMPGSMKLTLNVPRVALSLRCECLAVDSFAPLDLAIALRAARWSSRYRASVRRPSHIHSSERRAVTVRRMSAVGIRNRSMMMPAIANGSWMERPVMRELLENRK